LAGGFPDCHQNVFNGSQNMKKAISLFVLITFLLTLTSCGSPQKPPAIEAKSDAVTITVPPEVNTFKINDFVNVEVQNNLDHEILLSLDSAIDIKAKQEDNWITVPLAQKLSRKILLSSQSEKDTSLTLFSIIPQIQSGKATDIRITIKGIDQLTNQELFGYVDITLNP